jgi:hypothetical protein
VTKELICGGCAPAALRVPMNHGVGSPGLFSFVIEPRGWTLAELCILNSVGGTSKCEDFRAVLAGRIGKPLLSDVESGLWAITEAPL